MSQRYISVSYSKRKKPSRLNIRDLIADVLLTGLSASFLWHFSNIWRYGQYLQQEPNIVIRSAETALFIAILVFGISKFISDVKRLREI